jgi:hypothetical protein
MAAIVVDAAATAAVLATNFVAGLRRRLFYRKPPGPSNGPEAFVDRETNSITFGVGEVTGLIDPQKIDGQSTRSQ